MRFFVVFSVAVACVLADISHVLKDEANAPILKSSYDLTFDGNFKYIYETANGISAQADGVIKNPNSEYPDLTIQGSYRYVSPDGTPVEVSYVADEGGFKPVSSHIPIPPPIPELILKAQAYIAAHPPHAEPLKGAYQG